MRKTEKDTPNRILGAALHLVARDGYARVSMRDIAREAGVSISQISYHFSNKEGLFAALILELKENVISDFNEGLTHVSGAGGFADFLCAYAKESISRNVELHRLRIELSNLAISSGIFRAEFAAVTEELTDILAARLEACEPRPKLLASCDAAEAARFIISVIFGVSAQYLLGGEDAKSLDTIDVLREILR